MAEVQTVDKTMIMTVIVSMEKTKGVDMIDLAWHQSSKIRIILIISKLSQAELRISSQKKLSQASCQQAQDFGFL